MPNFHGQWKEGWRCRGNNNLHLKGDSLPYQQDRVTEQSVKDVEEFVQKGQWKSGYET